MKYLIIELEDAESPLSQFKHIANEAYSFIYNAGTEISESRSNPTPVAVVEVQGINLLHWAYDNALTIAFNDVMPV